MVRRIYVEKKKGFDVEAQHMLADLRENLGITGLSSLRLLNRYDVCGLSEEEFWVASNTIFSEPNADDIFGAAYSFPEGQRVFAMEYLPGQYDQRADSAAQCISLLTQKERPKVVTARIVAVSGTISDQEFSAIQAYLVNPVESRVASMELPLHLDMEAARPADVERVGNFIHFDEAALRAYHASMGFAMSVEDLLFCQKYFSESEHRDPSVTELRVIDTYWSDHCRHTTFLTQLSRVETPDDAYGEALKAALTEYFETRKAVYGERNKPVTMMDMATLGGKYLRKTGKLPDLDVSEEINACSIEVPVTVDGKTEPWLVQFKNETHNHPTEIEPFGGAATCLGGAIRDPLSGRAYVYQAMRVTGSGDPRIPFEKTLHGKLPSRKITTSAAHGYSSYGNQIGLATGQVTELYDPGYVAKRMEIGAVIGASPKENVVRMEPVKGDIIILLGGATGRDGCGGATGSSKAHTEKSIEVCGAEVQKGNPPTERKIQRLFRNPEVSRLIKRCNDFGAGGVCVAIGELAPGLEIDLDCVPKKYEGLDGTELAISESQERMAVVVARENAEAFIAASRAENLDANTVAVVTDSARLQMRWRGDLTVDISREFLDTNGVAQTAEAEIESVRLSDNYMEKLPEELASLSLSDAFRKNLSRLSVCSQKGLSERFDASIGASTVQMPFAGTYQLSPEEAMVAKLPILSGETNDATAMSYGYIPGISKFSPYYGAQYAVVESLSKLAAAGADPLSARLTFQEYFEKLGTDKTRWGKPVSALLGSLHAQLALGVPAIGGKDSMSGSFEKLDVPPTLVSFAVSMTKASQTLSACFSEAGTKAVLLPIPTDSLLLPDYAKVTALYRKITELTREGKILAAGVVKEGGCAAVIAKMCFGNHLGFSFCETDPKLLFSAKAGAIVVCVRDEACTKELGGILLGSVTAEPVVSLGNEQLSLEELIRTWSAPLEKVFPGEATEVPVSRDIPLFSSRSACSPKTSCAVPKVFIPVFPGTNCEYDSARAFRRAGANTDVLVVRNLTPSDIEYTIDEMAKRIRSSQMIMIPGGFSGGDEPDGSGKFIATTFRNPKIAEAVTELLEKRDGLILGICNGFQALIKTGLVPYGRITPPNEAAPTLTFNTLGRHVSRMAYTRVTSVKSPWFSLVNAGDVFAVPVSHGEGRFVASDSVLSELIKNGQVATQYTTPAGVPDGSVTWNPNGSVCAIEGITSPDGRILGKMGHSERQGKDLYRNVPGEKDQKIFESGVRYFK